MTTVDRRRGFAPRGLTGTPSASKTRQAERVAVVDFSRIERMVDLVVTAMFDNASTQVVDRKQYAEIFGVNIGLPLWTLRDLEISEFDETGAWQTKENLLRHMALQMARGPDAFAQAVQELLQVKELVHADLHRKLKLVGAASDADAKRLGQIVNGLETTKLVCDVVSIWSPVGAVSRGLTVVNKAEYVLDAANEIDEFRKRIGGANGLVAAFGGDREAQARLGAAATAVLAEKALNWGIAKAGRKLAAASTRRLRKSEVTELIPSTFAGPATDRRYSNKEVKKLMWLGSSLAESADVLFLDTEDQVNDAAFTRVRQLLSPGRTPQ